MLEPVPKSVNEIKGFETTTNKIIKSNKEKQPVIYGINEYYSRKELQNIFLMEKIKEIQEIMCQNG